MKNPFTHTPGRAGDANIPTDLEEQVYENFRYNPPSEYVFKIVGVRGSGKTVLFGNILRHYREQDKKDGGWLVYDLSSARNPINTILSYLELEPEVKKALIPEKTKISASVPVIGINASYNAETSYDVEVRLEQLIGILVKSKKKIMIGIDDISKTEAMTQFCSVYAKLIRNETEEGIPWPVFLICSGVYQNFYELGEVDNLTFFKRAYEIKTEPFATPAMARVYEDKLDVQEEDAIRMAQDTKGFAYAYQVLGSAYFLHKEKGMEYVVKQAKSELFSQCYEKIWKEIPEGGREILKIVHDGPKRRKEIVSQMKNGGNYQVYSTALKKMGILKDSDESYGTAEIALPFFGEYVKKYC